MENWLVVWNMFYDFPYIGNFIIPTDYYFSELKPPTINPWNWALCTGQSTKG